MKTRICSSWLLGLVLLVLPLAGCLQESSLSTQGGSVAAAEVASPPETPAVDPVAESSENTDPDEALAQADEQSISTAPARKVSTEIEVPANLKPSPATAEIIKLANAGAAENVMLAFVTNSLGTFNLRAEEIIYLNDIGVPSAVVTAMLQRDHLLQDSNLTFVPAELDLSGVVPDTSSVSTPSAPPLEVSQTQPPMFDSTPAYGATDYAVPVDTEPSPTDYTDYYDSLALYGSWVDVAGYGRCWQPTIVAVNRGWCPYFNGGRWVYTDCGWYWMSDYSWGWAPFHYGRWFQHATLGWCWRPDRVWGPSWVCWRHDGDFCGWAPLPPGARFVASVGLTFHGRPVRNGFSFGLGADHFRFVHSSHFLAHDLGRHVLPRDHTARIFDHTLASTGIEFHNHRVVNNGISRDHVATATHANIVPVTLHNVSPSAGIGVRERFERNGRTLAVYRPDVQPRTPARTPTVARENQPPSNNGAAGSSIPTHGRLAQIQPQSPPTVARQPAAPPRVQAPVRIGQPLILRGSDHPRETAMAPDAGKFEAGRGGPAAPSVAPNQQNTRRTAPLSSLVVIGQNQKSRFGTTQRDNRTALSSRNGTLPSSNRDFRHNLAQNPMGEDDMRYNNHRSQTPAQSTWWAQPNQPGMSGQQQLQHNREMPARGAGNWNASVEQPRYNPAHIPQQSYSAPIQSQQQHFAPVESRPTHSAPMEAHQSQPAHVESHQSHSAPVESRPAQSAPAPAPSSSSSSSSSSHDSSSHSSGRGR
jgi:hypothetical protein